MNRVSKHRMRNQRPEYIFAMLCGGCDTHRTCDERNHIDEDQEGNLICMDYRSSMWIADRKEYEYAY